MGTLALRVTKGAPKIRKGKGKEEKEKEKRKEGDKKEVNQYIEKGTSHGRI